MTATALLGDSNPGCGSISPMTRGDVSLRPEISLSPTKTNLLELNHRIEVAS